MKNTILILLLFMGINTTIFSQKKYAVLIAIQPAQTEIGTINTKHAQCWIETFLMWEKLQKQGYAPQNIHVLFNKGTDYQSPSIADRYKPDIGIIISDAAATKANIINLFESLKNDLSNKAKPSKTDTLFIWSYEKFNANNNYSIPLLNGNINMKEFSKFTNALPAYKILNVNNKHH